MRSTIHTEHHGGRPFFNNEQLALALLLDLLHHQEAVALHRRFADEVIDKLPHGRSPLFLSRQEIMAWISAKNMKTAWDA